MGNKDMEGVEEEGRRCEQRLVDVMENSKVGDRLRPGCSRGRVRG